MGGFAVAALGALSAPVVGPALIAMAGGFWHWILFGVQFGTLLFASAVSRKRPLNRIAYALFTYISGTIAGIIALLVARGAGFTPVFLAFGLTGVVFMTLTVTAFVSKKDFSFLRNFVIVGIAVMFFGSLAAAIFRLETFSLIISGVAVIACSAKLLWDTSTMLRTDDFGDPAGFALSLFVSLYNIFISLMNLLGGRRR
ncbi:MAG: Bax inhibitor-1 family protein [Holophagaceae bacterium]|uniref:Bax inhibitor-1 family protein n=1 Tax=Candidatus Geothrix skivensis TaxID=2954439 RepID=A0A9D7XH40_9BACT|nr:Bax inhibitor-1 family protein [Candidatus Geothrix skivensis]